MAGVTITNTNVYGIDDSMRAMRNPMKSHHRSAPEADRILGEALILGNPERKDGIDHAEERKHLRFITVISDWQCPRWLWQEIDSYKVGITTLSESTVHTINKRGLTLEDFSYDPEIRWLIEKRIREINKYIWASHSEKGKDRRLELLRIIKQLLPECFLQKRTVQMNYESLRNMYHQRKNHKMKEWHEICAWMETLPESWMITEVRV